jgi:hypothetical protein
MTLQELMIEAYGDRGPYRRDRSKGRKEFCIDDQAENDVPRAFCNMTITLPDSESNDFRLTLYPVPWDKDVEALVDALGGKWHDNSIGRVLKVPLTIRSVPDIRRLARAIRKVTGRGKRYVNANWKWSTRRTAGSLERFARLLSEWNRCGRRMVPEEVLF